MNSFSLHLLYQWSTVQVFSLCFCDVSLVQKGNLFCKNNEFYDYIKHGCWLMTKHIIIFLCLDTNFTFTCLIVINKYYGFILIEIYFFQILLLRFRYIVQIFLALKLFFNFIKTKWFRFFDNNFAVMKIGSGRYFTPFKYTNK